MSVAIKFDKTEDFRRNTGGGGGGTTVSPTTTGPTTPLITIKFLSSPIHSSIFINGNDSSKTTPNVLYYNPKALLNGRVFTVSKSGWESTQKYRVKTIEMTVSGISIATYIVVVDQYLNGKWVNLSKNTLEYVSLDFSLNTSRVPPIEYSETYEVRFLGDVSSDDIISYSTSANTNGFIKNGDDFTISLDVIPGNTNEIGRRESMRPGRIDRLIPDTMPWVKLQSNGVTNYTHLVKYSITDRNNPQPLTIENEFTKTLLPGLTTISAVVNKLAEEISPKSPIVSVSNTSLQYNINDTESLRIPYTSQYSDSIIYVLGNTKRELPKNGSISLSKKDFNSGIGSYILYLQPVSDIVGTGLVKRININVINKSHSPGPDITHITYPENIQGADFKGYNENFIIGWQSVNTNYIEVYVNKKDNEFAIARVSDNGSLTLNVAEILSKGKITHNDSTDKIPFELVLIPFNIGGDEVVEGKTERITVVFDKGELRLKRGQVLFDIQSAFKSQFDISLLKEETSKYLTHYAHFGDGENKVISTWGIDTETFSTYTTGSISLTGSFNESPRQIKEVKSLVLKLYEPLPRNIQPNQQLWLSKIQSVPLIGETIANETIEVDESPLLPCFDCGDGDGDGTGLEIIDDLLSTGETVDKYLGTNAFSLEMLNLKYWDETDYLWNNFIKYSSAVERVENFFYKIQAIEAYDAKYDLLLTTSGSLNAIAVKNEMAGITTTINKLKSGFDAFENKLYKTPDDAFAYPGAGDILSGSSDSSVQSWYTTIIDSATTFDWDNKNALVRNIPQHLIDDSENEDFVLFFNMIGQHFDILSSYTKGITESKKIVHNYDSGITNELIYHMLESLGWDADMGMQSQQLWEYAFGKNVDGSTASAMSGKQRQQEIWRRLLNNLPYLFKHKGTKRALTAVMSCYGIPTSMLTIMEFGGPVDPTVGTTTNFTFDDRTAAISLDGTSSILVPYNQFITTGNKPQSIELRVNTSLKEKQTLITAEDWDLSIIPGTGSLAAIQLYFTGSDTSSLTNYFPFFDGEYTQIVVQRTVSGNEDTYWVYAKEGFNERIRNEVSSTLSITTGASTWANGPDLIIGDGFVGNVDEFRLWSVPLSEANIVNHTLLPDAIDGNDYNSSTEDLIFRLDFEYPKDRSAAGDLDIKNVSINRKYGEDFATAQNFTSITTYPYQYVSYERSVTAVVPATGIGLANKIRFESQTLENYLKFGDTSNVTSFDDAVDSNKLGLFFSPTREINMDILRSLGTFNIDNYIGNPGDEYADGYSELNNLRNYYFKRFDLNIYEYIQLVRYI